MNISEVLSAVGHLCCTLIYEPLGISLTRMENHFEKFSILDIMSSKYARFDHSDTITTIVRSVASSFSVVLTVSYRILTVGERREDL